MAKLRRGETACILSVTVSFRPGRGAAMFKGAACRRQLHAPTLLTWALKGSADLLVGEAARLAEGAPVDEGRPLVLRHGVFAKAPAGAAIAAERHLHLRRCDRVVLRLARLLGLCI